MNIVSFQYILLFLANLHTRSQYFSMYFEYKIATFFHKNNQDNYK